MGLVGLRAALNDENRVPRVLAGFLYWQSAGALIIRMGFSEHILQELKYNREP